MARIPKHELDELKRHVSLLSLVRIFMKGDHSITSIEIG